MGRLSALSYMSPPLRYTLRSTVLKERAVDSRVRYSHLHSRIIAARCADPRHSQGALGIAIHAKFSHGFSLRGTFYQNNYSIKIKKTPQLKIVKSYQIP